MLLYVKKLYSELVFPRGKELLVLGFFVGVYMLGAAFVINGDSSYSYAMLERMADPTAFASNDITILGNLEGNFLFYRLLYHVPWYAHNFVLSDFLIGSVVTLLLLLAWYNIFFELTRNRGIATAALIVLLFVDDRLSLGGTILPMFYLTSIASVLFAQTFAVFFYLKGHPILSFTILSLTTYFHPPSGLFFLMVLGILFLVQSVQKKEYRPFIWSVIVAAVIFLPNAILVTHRIGEAGDTERFFTIFRQLSGPKHGHNYVESYFEAYLFTLSAWALLVVMYIRKKLLYNRAREIMVMISIIFLVVGVWLINLYTIKHLQIFYLYFAMRSTYLIKPLFICLFSLFAFNAWNKKTLIDRLIAVCLMGSLLVPHIFISITLLAVVALYYLFDIGKYNMFTKINNTFDYLEQKKTVRYSAVVILVCTLLGGASLFLYRHNNKLHKVYRLLQGENVFNFSFDPEKNYGINKAYPPFGEVVDWARQYKGKMFITPPDNCMFSITFRFITKNSIYSNICDVFQLNYTPRYFYEAYDRMMELHSIYVSPGVFDFTGYNRLQLDDLQKKQADFVIFDKTSPGYEKHEEKPVFENKQYIIYQLK